MDVNNDGTVDWEAISPFMVEMRMKGWAKSGLAKPTYSYAGPVDGAQPTSAADQVCECACRGTLRPVRSFLLKKLHRTQHSASNFTSTPYAAAFD